MLRRWSSRLQATLGSDGARVRVLRRLPFGSQHDISDRSARCSTAASDVTEVISALDEALRETAQEHAIAGLRCDVAVDDSWMIYDVIAGDLGDNPRRAADDLAAAALADTAGLHSNEIVVRWQRQGKLRNLACALPTSAVQALQGVLHRHRVQLGTINGELVQAYNAMRHGFEPAAAVLAVPRSNGTQIGLIDEAGFAALRYEPRVCEPAALLECSRALMRCVGVEPDESTRFYADETLAADTDTPWISQVPSPRWSQRADPRNVLSRLDLDLSPTRPAVRPMSWALLIAGALTVSVAAMQFQTASGQHLRESRALQALEASLSETRTGRTAKAAPEEAKNARASAAVVRELQVPWGRFFGALEAVADQNVALLSVEPSAQRQEIRVVAEAKSADAMFDFLEALRAQSLREVVLVSHQLQSQTPGTPIRFQARAVWESQ